MTCTPAAATAMRTCPGHVLFWLLTALASAAHAEDRPLLEQKIRIGAPARELTLAVRSQDHVTLTVSGKRHELGTQNVSAARVEMIQLEPFTPSDPRT